MLSGDYKSQSIVIGSSLTSKPLNSWATTNALLPTPARKPLLLENVNPLYTNDHYSDHDNYGFRGFVLQNSKKFAMYRFLVGRC